MSLSYFYLDAPENPNPDSRFPAGLYRIRTPQGQHSEVTRLGTSGRSTDRVWRAVLKRDRYNESSPGFTLLRAALRPLAATDPIKDRMRALLDLRGIPLGNEDEVLVEMLTLLDLPAEELGELEHAAAKDPTLFGLAPILGVAIDALARRWDEEGV